MDKLTDAEIRECILAARKESGYSLNAEINDRTIAFCRRDARALLSEFDALKGDDK